ncbi:MAG: hypothetical protein CO093_06780 [Alphaproteobacteria bacterium CG_4_9_14_3_um_filter_47_13]|nr:MAG: hypothetical protein CO093_06780 [Alphaproteobacteria bacterium CG_4_9_14_3_um_filter_47_13]
MSNERTHHGLKKTGFKNLMICFVFCFAMIFASRLLWACIDTCCGTVVTPTHIITREVISLEHNNLRINIFGTSSGILPVPTLPPDGPGRLEKHERWLIEVFFMQYLAPALMMMTEQLTTVMAEQMLVVGTYFDADTQMDTQLLLQQLEAQAHKDYQPDFGMCEFGTNVRSLAASDFNGNYSRMVLNKHFMDRQLGNGSSVGAGGTALDRANADTATVPTPYQRLGYFLKNTCDRNDLNRVIGNANTGNILCAIEPQNNGWVNRDIDWTNNIMGPRTLNVDYKTTFAESASDNERLLEMSNLLYGHEVFSRPDGTLLKAQRNQDDFLDSRSVTAKRSIAQTSFNAIVGLKSRGTRLTDGPGGRVASSEETAEFMRFFLIELGIPETEAQEYRQYMFQKSEAHEPPGAADSERGELSYYAQMEILAKKIYQRPEFYTGLYDKPANTKRKGAAMQAIKSMLDRDIFNSQLRAEAITSMILELKVVEEQQNIENKLGLMKEQGR